MIRIISFYLSCLQRNLIESYIKEVHISRVLYGELGV